MQKNIVHNENIDFNAKKVIFPAQSFVTGQITGASVVVTSGFGSGTPNLVQLGTSKMPAMRLALTTDELDFMWVPVDFDNRHPLYVRYLWTSDYAVANGTATFTTLYQTINRAGAPSAPATACTIAAGASDKFSATARALYWSKFSVIAPIATGANANGTFDVGTNVINFNVRCTAVSGITIASDFVYIAAAELTYTPRLTFGSSDRPGRMLIDGLQATLELDPSRDL